MRILNRFILIILVCCLVGCGGVFDWLTPEPTIVEKGAEYAKGFSGGGSYAVLPMVGGLSMVGGLLLLFVTFGKRGWLPLVIGVCLVVLNIFIMEYLHAVAIPVIVRSSITLVSSPQSH